MFSVTWTTHTTGWQLCLIPLIVFPEWCWSSEIPRMLQRWRESCTRLPQTESVRCATSRKGASSLSLDITTDSRKAATRDLSPSLISWPSPLSHLTHWCMTRALMPSCLPHCITGSWVKHFGSSCPPSRLICSDTHSAHAHSPLSQTHTHTQHRRLPSYSSSIYWFIWSHTFHHFYLSC